MLPQKSRGNVGGVWLLKLPKISAKGLAAGCARLPNSELMKLEAQAAILTNNKRGRVMSVRQESDCLGADWSSQAARSPGPQKSACQAPRVVVRCGAVLTASDQHPTATDTFINIKHTFYHVGRFSFGSGVLNLCCAQRARVIAYRGIVICATRVHVEFENLSLPFGVSKACNVCVLSAHSVSLYSLVAFTPLTHF